MADTLTTALIWTLFILVVAPVSAAAWVFVWWCGE
ncbi:hypothetical protein MSKU9_3284 [Komagataeibacter diospyri]|uniref:Uncharacterized protein n=1 Tax=Komagataeibacter diospyri TaxID=1932662 RepID=A0A4P5NU41_9PROT|nr:hypothetical protein MSKU9_3284 [Komagataeibacter diospyri]